MKKILMILSLALSTQGFANLNTSIDCFPQGYKVTMTENINEAPENPLSIVTVYKNGEEVYRELYKQSYHAAGDFLDMEIWGFEGYYHDDGVIGVAAASETQGKADLFIDLGDGEYVDGSSVECKLDR